jgi:hypothetical protein
VLVGRNSVAVGGSELLNPMNGADALEATTLPIMIMVVLVMVIYGNWVPERITPWRRARSSISGDPALSPAWAGSVRS